MRMNIQWRNVAGLSEPDRQAIERRLEALAAEHGDLIDVQIAAKPTQHHRHGGQEVRVSGHARGRDLVATRVRDDLAQALAEVLDAFEREVRKLRERRTDERTARVTEPPVLGVIDRVLTDRGYGFILTDDGEEVYFHQNALHELDFASLTLGLPVELEIERGERGPQASRVFPVGERVAT
jgi:CspA family cold shock protein